MKKLKTYRKQYQQGDVCFTRIEKIPTGAKATRRTVIAEGEATGHEHKVIEVDGKIATIFERDTEMFLQVAPRSTAMITHQEHSTTTLPPGDYEVTRIFEKDPFTEEIQRVID